jgi:hypothetical protein
MLEQKRKQSRFGGLRWVWDSERANQKIGLTNYDCKETQHSKNNILEQSKKIQIEA